LDLLALKPDKLPATEALEFKASSPIADGHVVVQYFCGKDRLIIDLSLSARLGKGLLGHAEVKAKSEWQKKEAWEPKDFSMESQLWGMQKKTSFSLEAGQLDPLSVSYALRGNPIHNVGESRLFKTRDETREKTIELYALEKKREATDLFGSAELIKLEFRERNDGTKRPDFWHFWIESDSNILTRIDIGHQKLGNLTFKLVAKR
jgi:hypothetical protein